jgi:signal transduction histidine kinase/uncharacterized protein YhfF
VSDAPRDDLLREVAVGTANATGDAFLWTLVRVLGTSLGPGVCWVSELVGEETALRALASWPAASLPEGATHALVGTPVVAALEQGECFIAGGVSAAYPEDPFLGCQGLDGYVGLPCRSTEGEVVGVLEVATERALGSDADVESLRIFASWVGAEIHRRRQRASLRSREAELLASRMRVLAAADDERRRIGRDLHDGVQQRVLALKMLVNTAYESLDGTLPPSAAGLLDDAVEEANAIGSELRSLARGLHPAGLVERGLEGTFEQLARRAAVPLHVRSIPDRRLPAPIELTVYYLVSEALANTAKHAHDAELTVDVELTANALRAVASDTGPGGADLDSGSGLSGLRDRVTALGGRLTVASPPGEGTTLTADIPLAPFRDARDPFMEFGGDGDGGDGAEKIRRILAGEQRLSVSLAHEWDLEGGPPRIGQELALRDHTGRRHGTIVVTRVAVMPLALIDADMASEVAGKPLDVEEWRADLRHFWEQCREDTAVLLGQPDWRLTNETPMVILWFEAISR